MMKTTFVTMLALGTWPLISTAMPTKAELDKVSPVVADLMRPEQEALKAGKKSKSEVAAIALELVAKADGEAAKLLLTKGAYNLYVRDGDFDRAIATLKSFREIVPDMEPQYLANIIESSLRTISRKNGGQLYRLLDETRTIARYKGELKKLEVQAKKAPTDKLLQLKIAEHYAVLNDWTNALDAFELSSDRKASDVAKMEKANAKAQKVAADFWWNYPVRKAPEFEKPFRQHAAKLYEQAIASGELVGLNKVQADRRIEEAKVFGETAFQSVADDVSIDGLVHLWNFNDGFNDCVSGYVPSVQGDVTIKNGVCTLGSDGGKVGLRTVNGLLGNGTFTLEAWYTENARTYGTRALFANGNGMGMMWASGCGEEGYFSFDRQQPGRGTQDMQFELGHKTYLAITHVKDSQQVVAYKYDTVTKSFVSVKADVERAIPMFNSGIVLGESCNKNTARASYDEVRLWKRCLTSREVERSAKAGPNALNDSVVRVRTSSSIGKQKEKSFAKVKREMEETIAAQHEDKLYCVIDLSGGPNAKRYPVSYLNSAPKTGWSDEYKTTKLVLRKINPGKFKMGGSYDVKLTKPYYMGVFEVTQRQWELVTGTNTSHFKGNDLCPVEQVSYEMLRGKHVGAGWPQSNDVDAISFMGMLQQRANIQFDLPTEAQWEYACSAGLRVTPLNGDYAWYKDNAAERTHPVGIKLPNGWGLYDMMGNVWEWCLDWHGQLLSGSLDPKGSTSGMNRVARGGSWSDAESLCTSSVRGNIYPSYRSINYGFRLSIRLK